MTKATLLKENMEGVCFRVLVRSRSGRKHDGTQADEVLER